MEAAAETSLLPSNDKAIASLLDVVCQLKDEVQSLKRSILSLNDNTQKLCAHHHQHGTPSSAVSGNTASSRYLGRTTKMMSVFVIIYSSVFLLLLNDGSPFT
jgi:hypothetical protein